MLVGCRSVTTDRFLTAVVLLLTAVLLPLLLGCCSTRTTGAAVGASVVGAAVKCKQRVKQMYCKHKQL
jgi:hypothetical protein